MNEMPLMDQVAVRQLRGDRSQQEDEYGLCEIDTGSGNGTDHFLLVLADGMGGHVGGEQASNLVIRAFIEAYQTLDAPIGDRLRNALDTANVALSETISKMPVLNGMGCTLVGASIADGAIHWISVGDSPLWLLHEGRLIRLNADHSMVPVLADLVEAGHISREEAAGNAQRSALRSAVTGSEINLIDQSLEARPLAPGDRILLASDGIQTLREDEIESITGGEGAESIEATADLLVGAIEQRAREGQDNTTLMLFQFDGPEQTEGDCRHPPGDVKGEMFRGHDDA